MIKTTLLLFVSIFISIHFSFSQTTTNKLNIKDNRYTAAPVRSVIDNGVNGIEVSYNFYSPIKIEKKFRKEVFTNISITDFSHLQEVGKPALPSHIDLIAIPDGAKYKLKINNDIPMVSSTKRIYPALQPARDTEGAPEPKFEINKEFYNTDAVYPSQSVRIIGEMIFRGIRMIKVEVCPIQYNPSSSKLYTHNDINYEIEFSGANTFTDYSKNTESYMNTILNYPLNYVSFTKEAKKYYSQNKQAITTGNSKNYIIITHPNFADAADSIASWKRQLGYSVEIVSSNSWTVATVKNAVHSRYQAWTPKPDYLLIIGDVADVPAETHYTSQNDAFGTDLYYVCMDGTSDYIPDMAKGRISPSNAANALMQVQKIINYERYPVSDTSFYTNVLNCAQYQDDNTNMYADRRFLHTSEDIRDYVMTKGYSSQRIYYTASNVTPQFYNNGYYSNGQALPSVLLKSNGFNWNGGASDITSAINSGKLFVFHRDHGFSGGSGWAHPRYVNSKISQLNNGNKLPVVFSINCHTGEYTLNSCFAETFMRKSNGGTVGIFAASYYSYSGYNDGFSLGLIDGIWSNPGLIPNFGNGGVSNPNVTPHTDITIMGDLLNHGLTRVIQTWGGNNSSNRYTHELFHYFGDPAMRMWTENPSQIIATSADTVGCSATSFVISNCNVNSAVATLVSNGVLMGKTSLVNGNGIIPLGGVQLSQLTLTISSPNMRPLTKTINLGSGTNFSIYSHSGDNVCFNNNIADIEIFPGCGIPPYQILWSSGDTIAHLNNVASGTYTVIVTDAANSTVYDTIVVSGPSASTQITSNVTNATCFFQGSGSIELQTNGVNAPHAYLWSTGQTDSNIYNIPAGQYSVAITDSYGCEQSFNYSVSQPPAINLSFTKMNDVTGTCTGELTANGMGGTPPYSYLWNDASAQTTATITNLCSGYYKVKLTDDNGCYTYKTAGIENTVGIESVGDNNEVLVSPNPSNTGVFTITFSKDVEKNYVLYNSIGELIISGKIKSNTKVIDLSKYAQGIYYLQIGNSTEKKVYKLIYQK